MSGAASPGSRHRRSSPWPCGCRRGWDSGWPPPGLRSTPCSPSPSLAASSGTTGCAARVSSTRAAEGRAGLHRVLVDLAGADADGVLDRGDEDLAVADLAGLGSLDDGIDAAVGVAILDDNLDFHLGQEIDDVLGAAIQLGMTLLPAKALYFRDGEAGDTDLGERLAHLLELERLDDGGDLLHGRLQ